MRESIDIYQWKDYAIFRILESKPFPSPKVWDSSRGIISDLIKINPFKKEIFFPNDFPEINKELKSKYSNNFRIDNENKQLSKADGTLGKSEAFLNLFKEKQFAIASCRIDLNVVCEKNGLGNSSNMDKEINNIEIAVDKIFDLCKKTNIDCGYVPTTQDILTVDENFLGKKSWERINMNLEIYSDRDNIHSLLFQYIAKEFNVDSEELVLVGEQIKDPYWLFKLFNYSFIKTNWEKFNLIKIKPLILQNKQKSEFNDENFEVNSNDSYDDEIKALKKELELLKKDKSLLTNSDSVSPKNSLIADSEIVEINSETEFLKGEGYTPNKMSEFNPSIALIPEGFISCGNEIEDLKYALNNPLIGIRSFFNDCEFIKQGVWSESTLFCEPFDENLYGNLIKEYHRYSISELNTIKSEELKKAERKGAGIGAAFGILTGGLMAPFTAVLGANMGRMYTNNVDKKKPIKSFLPDPYLLFVKDEGSFTSLQRRYQQVYPKRRICMRKKFLENGSVYWEIFPMILFSKWATPAQIFKLENKYYLRPISANLTKDDANKLSYNPVKMRRSYSYLPGLAGDFLSLEPVFSTKIIGETIEKEPVVFKAKLKDDSSFTHYYFDYGTDGKIF